MQTLFLIILFSMYSAPQPGSSIPWTESRKLVWTDFLAKPDAASGNAAMTNSVINIEFNIDDTSLDYTISCRFDKNKSWVKVRTAPVLQHEQGHFDIAEIYARKLNKELKALNFNPSSIRNDVNVIYDKIMTVYQQVQHQYDQETDFSRNKPKQAEWLAKIAADIQSLEAHAGYAITQVISQKSSPKK